MAKNTLETKRHSLAHLLAAAVKELYPQAKLAIGPAIDNGFYYDIDFGDHKFSDNELSVLEEKMKQLIIAKLEFVREERDVDAALAEMQAAGEVYKEELIKDLKAQGELKVSFYNINRIERWLKENEDKLKLIVIKFKKIKKDKKEILLRLKPTRDIAETLGKIKSSSQILVGFALETDNELDNAKAKLSGKNLDLVVLNSLKEEGAGFGHDTNKITIIDRNNNIDKFELKSKDEAAKDILDKIVSMIQKKAIL